MNHLTHMVNSVYDTIVLRCTFFFLWMDIPKFGSDPMDDGIVPEKILLEISISPIKIFVEAFDNIRKRMVFVTFWSTCGWTYEHLLNLPYQMEFAHLIDCWKDLIFLLGISNVVSKNNMHESHWKK